MRILQWCRIHVGPRGSSDVVRLLPKDITVQIFRKDVQLSSYEQNKQNILRFQKTTHALLVAILIFNQNTENLTYNGRGRAGSTPGALFPKILYLFLSLKIFFTFFLTNDFKLQQVIPDTRINSRKYYFPYLLNIYSFFLQNDVNNGIIIDDSIIVLLLSADNIYVAFVWKTHCDIQNHLNNWE